jgi:hypothetical protein
LKRSKDKHSVSTPIKTLIYWLTKKQDKIVQEKEKIMKQLNSLNWLKKIFEATQAFYKIIT